MTTHAPRLIGRAALVLPLLAGLTLAPPAHADGHWGHGGWGRGGWGHGGWGRGGWGHEGWEHGGWGPGAALAAGVVGLGIGAALAPRYYAPPPVVYAPPPVVYAPPPVYYAAPAYPVYRPY